MYFSQTTDKESVALIKSNDYQISFSAKDAESVKAKVRENKIIYKNVYPHIDLQYTVLGNSVKEELVINAMSELEEITFDINAYGLSAVEKDGIISFCNDNGECIYEVGSLFAEDANGVRSENIEYKLIETGTNYEYRIIVDREFLNDPNTAYPVVIDPSYTVTGGASTYDTCVDQQYPTSNYYLSQNLWTGGKLGTNAMRTYIKFDLPTSFYGDRITSAYLRIKKNAYETPTIKAYRVTSSWTPSSVTWNNKPGHRTSGTNTITHYSGDWYQINTTTIVRSWMNGDDNYGFVLKEPSESSQSQKTRYYSSDASSPNKPELVINYRNCGSRPYQTCITQTVNCMGYALEYTDYIDSVDLNITTAELSDLDQKGNEEILDFLMQKAEDWMDEHIDALYEPVTSYSINTTGNYYLVGLRVGFSDTGIVNNKFDYNDNCHELLDFHWWYRTNEGSWADKLAYNESVHRTNTNAATDPEAIIWQGCGLEYDSQIQYYKIADVRTPSLIWFRNV